MSKIKLNNVDLAWLRMESPTNPMMITVVLEFNGLVDYDKLIADLRVTLARYRRFRQRIVQPQKIFQRPYWEDDPDYRVEDHVERLELPEPVNEAALEELVNQKMNTMLDFTYPLWMVTMVDNYPAGSILVVRVHHCIADGISLLGVLLQMTRPSSEDDADQGDATPKLSQRALNRKPSTTEIIAAIASIFFRRPDPPTRLKGKLGTRKRAVYSKPLSVPEIKVIAKANQATINDVLMAAAAGAFRRYIEEHNDARKPNINAFVLVNMRGASFDEELGNKFGLVFLPLPLDRGQPLERLNVIKQNMDLLKASAEYAATYVLLIILGGVPAWMEHLATLFLDTKGTVVATNVPGPRRELSLAGAPIRSIRGAVPQSGRIGVGLSFISYNNQLVVGLNADVGLIPDPERFIELYSEEFKSFQNLL